MARRRRLGWIRYSYLRGLRLPGVRGSDRDSTVQQRDSAWFLRARARSHRRAGARTTSQKAADGELRAHGMPVFDRSAGQSELADYLHQGRRDE